MSDSANAATRAIRPLAGNCSVAAQMSPADMEQVVTLGFRSVVCNRPDGEGGAVQPPSSAVEAAAQAAGLSFAYLPVVPGQFTTEQVREMKTLLATLPPPILAYCRSGARSANLIQMAQLER